MLFYYNDQNYYISALESTFLYDRSPKLYELYWDISSGKDKKDLAKKIKNSFRSSYVLAAKSQINIKNTKKSFLEQFIENLDSDASFQKIYEDDESKIYQIKWC